ncbi:acyltransferase [Bradyrhizobium sp. LHD-71]|uniref:acyltransferase family protein n=1 Tax=Bradyrhizobium sp. LHD-71 TaxID=3072141 RepID=UPI00280E417F|nr:acyltransferase [Bradyrhizobium sp. LHD-71]MDQ8731098.1 acyltransferase [Bradyrhizobium sp. LHD-71]
MLPDLCRNNVMIWRGTVSCDLRWRTRGRRLVTQSDRFESLDAWRGVCALLVAFYHYVYSLPNDLQDVRFLHNSYLFVDFFFVLSGFVIFHAYRDRIDSDTEAWIFVIRRLGRVWPAHLATLAGFVAVVAAIGALPHPNTLSISSGQGEYSIPGLLLQVVLLNAMGLQGTATWNGPAWSIGAEFYTYLLFACVVLCGQRRLVIVSIGLSALALAVIMWRAPTYMNSTFDYGFLRCVAGFFAGGVAYHVHERCRAAQLKFATIAEIVSLTAVVLLVVSAGRNPDAVSAGSLAAPVVFAVVILIFAREQGVLSRLLKLAPFRTVARYSYSIYITHKLVLVMIVYLAWLTGIREVSAPPQQLGMFQSWPPGMLPFVFLAVVLLLSAASYRFVEVPGRNHFNRMATRLQENAREPQPHGLARRYLPASSSILIR